MATVRINTIGMCTDHTPLEDNDPDIVVEDGVVHIYLEHFEVQMTTEEWNQINKEVNNG
jgi:hypothetical protein